MSRQPLQLSLKLCALLFLVVAALFWPKPGGVEASGGAAVSAGWLHTCAITTSGGVKCWGGNFIGRLGDGTKTSSNIPVDVFGLTSGVAAVSAGAPHTCAVTTAGGLQCWGFNSSGELGDGTNTASNVPVAVSGGLTFQSVSGGGGNPVQVFGCGVTTAGTAYCWGFNSNGEFGDLARVGPV